MTPILENPFCTSIELDSFSKSKQKNTSLTNSLQGRKIVVLTKELGGYGDLLCAKKICLYLRQHLGVNFKNLALAVDPENIKNPILQTAQLNIISHDLLQVLKWGPDIQIMAPVTDSFFANPYVNSEDIPTLAISEYGFEVPTHLNYKNVDTYAFGLHSEGMGVLLNPELRELSESPAFKESINRLAYLQAVPVALQKAILEEKFSLKAIEKFNSHSSLYFGYAQKALEIKSFILAVINMNTKLKSLKNLCFYFMGESLTPDSIQEQKFQSDLKHFNIHSVKFKRIEHDCQTFVLNHNAHTTVTIITGLLNSDYVPCLYLSSEYETLATGDQSFGDTLSCKFPIYETFNHKYNLFQQFLQNLPFELERKIQAFYRPTYQAQLKHELDPDQLAHFFIERRSNPKLNDLIQKTLKNITDTFDFGPRFEKALEKLLEKTKEIKRLQISTAPLVLPAIEEITGQEIPYDTPVFLELKEIIKLSIDIESSRSKLPQFQDSIFDCRFKGDMYLCIRKKAEEDLENKK
jgi:hypothetical protein